MSLVSQSVEENDDPSVLNILRLMLCPCSASNFGSELAFIIKELSCSHLLIYSSLASLYSSIQYSLPSAVSSSEANTVSSIHQRLSAANLQDAFHIHPTPCSHRSRRPGRNLLHRKLARWGVHPQLGLGRQPSQRNDPSLLRQSSPRI